MGQGEKRFTMTLEKALHDRMTMIAKREKRSLVKQIEWVVERWLDEQEAKREPHDTGPFEGGE